MKTLNDFFDNIYCINLAHRSDKWEMVCKEFTKHLMIVERFNGVNGKEVFKEGMNRHAGAYGVLMSNLKIFEDAIRKGYKTILIFEDDVTFDDKLNEKFWEKIDLLPNDWHMLYLGGNHQFTWGKFEMITGDKSIDINKYNYRTFNNELVKTRWTQCAFAIGYKCDIFSDFLNRLKIWKEPIDVLQPLLQRDNIYNAYAFLPTLAKPRANFSDISNMFVDYVNNTDVNNF
jgi:hypothetical protein